MSPFLCSGKLVFSVLFVDLAKSVPATFKVKCGKMAGEIWDFVKYRKTELVFCKKRKKGQEIPSSSILR
jgi:hypothetical protein